MSEDFDNLKKSLLDTFMDDLDTIHDETNTVRNKLEKLLLDDLVAWGDGRQVDPEVQSARATTVKTIMDLLDAKDKNRLTKVNTRLRKKDSDTGSNIISQLVAETLKRTPMKDVFEAMKTVQDGAGIIPDTVSDEAINKAIKSRIASEGVVISEGELRDDHTDFSEYTKDDIASKL